jgi:hypothetical protein
MKKSKITVQVAEEKRLLKQTGKELLYCKFA